MEDVSLKEQLELEKRSEESETSFPSFVADFIQGSARDMRRNLMFLLAVYPPTRISIDTHPCREYAGTWQRSPHCQVAGANASTSMGRSIGDTVDLRIRDATTPWLSS